MDIQEIHKNLLELIVQFDKICIDNNIHYTLHGGSLLGAIREHGFIPWDDDIDTAMVRSEFKKLEEVLKDNAEFYIYGDIKKQFRRKNDGSMWIDIFVCDYISNSLEKKRKLLSLTVLDIMYKDKNSIKLVNFKKYSIKEWHIKLHILLEKQYLEISKYRNIIKLQNTSILEIRNICIEAMINLVAERKCFQQLGWKNICAFHLKMRNSQ